jgi:alpha-glucosidase (family GH31 glycosyl hydrolase)
MNSMSGIDRDEIIRLTEEYGGQWGINHTRRLLHLISMLMVGIIAACSQGINPASTVVVTSSPSGPPEVTRDPSGRVKFQVGNNYLILEFLNDDLLHFELSGVETQTDLSQPLHTTPMVAKTDYPGPAHLTSDGKGTFETDALKIQVDQFTLCLTAWDTTRQPALLLTTLCPLNLGQHNQGFTLTPETFTNAYGLGEAFSTSGTVEGDWVGQVRAPGSVMGNALVNFNGGAVGNAQFPVVYFTGRGTDNYALFADNAYAQSWNFQAVPWQVTMGGKWMRFYLMSGPDLQDLRKDYLELVGKPPVPPKKMFGLWVSEFGYDNWNELESKLRTLRTNHFPVDGFVLDLQWYGGIQSNSDDSHMGSLSWDLTNFPDPAGRITSLRDTQGVGIMTVEESYISKGLAEYTTLADKNYLARACNTCPPTYLTDNPWWGKGGMMDWTNTEGAAFWHDWKREPLIEAGVIGHWTDLGEPEMYDSAAWYSGIPGDYLPLERHADIHNLCNLLWSRSIYEGYLRNGHAQRPFILSRSGTSGSQRYGVAMWSGDIGSNLASLTSQMDVQRHMSMSGMDYFGSDIGGFHREGLDGDINEMYTQWFANSSLLDVPVRVHTENLCNCKDTPPDRIGDMESNLANIRLRVALSPYLYSLSQRAWLYGEPVFPPLVYFYQSDLGARDLTDEKMVGADMLVAQTAGYGLQTRKVYLPASDWVDYYTNQLIHSTGQQLGPFPLYRQGRFQLPLFARRGALIPQMAVDEKTMNVTGMRSDGSVRDELIVRVYAGNDPTSFTLYEDDGATTAYQSGEVRTTLLSQQQIGQSETVTIAAAQGNYTGASSSRDNEIMLVSETAKDILQVSLNGVALAQVGSLSEWEHASSGWYYADNNLVMVKTGRMPVGEDKVITFR